MLIDILRIIAILCTAFVLGKLVSKLKLPAILGWLIAGAGVFTFIYILSRAIGKTGGAYLGGKLTEAEPVVTKYLGFTLLPHSGVSLVFTGIAATTLAAFDESLAAIVPGTIVAAAIINEIIAVIVAKYAFKRAGEIPRE